MAKLIYAKGRKPLILLKGKKKKTHIPAKGSRKVA